LIILEKGLISKMSGKQEKQLLLTKRQQMSSRMALRKSLRRKNICLNRFFFTADKKCPILEKNIQ